MQLVAYGAQDVYLTGNPEVTFFQAKYKRHTNFAMENIEQTVNGTAADSGRVSVTVARNGDLVGDMYVELKVKASGIDEAGACWVAERAINNVELSIGGQRIDKQYQKWWRLYTELYLDDSKKATYGKMTSGISGKTVYLPLYFFFNRNPGLYLPLIALQYHEVRLDFDLSAHFDEWLDTSTFKVWANYIYLDTEERRRFAQKGHEYLIEQCQHTGADTVDSGSTKQVRLSYNHPVKELVWCFSNTLTQNSMFNFTTESNDADVKLHTAAAAATSNALVSLSTYGSPMLGLGVGSAVPPSSLRIPLVPSTPSSLCLTARTVSRSRRASTSTRCSPSSTTLAPPTPVSTRTPSRSSPRSTSLPALATSPALITRRLLSL